MKSSPLERPKNRYRSFSFWNLSFNDGSRLWRQAPGVTEGQKGANKFSKVCIVPYIYIYISTVLSSATGKILVNLPGVSYFAYLQLEFLAFQRSTRNQNHPSRFIYNCPSIERKNRQNWWKFCSKLYLIVISSITNFFASSRIEKICFFREK